MEYMTHFQPLFYSIFSHFFYLFYVLCCRSAIASPDVGGGGGGGASYGGACHIGSYFTENGKYHFNDFELII